VCHRRNPAYATGRNDRASQVEGDATRDGLGQLPGVVEHGVNGSDNFDAVLMTQVGGRVKPGHTPGADDGELEPAHAFLPL
jgi:hypothetical protein